ncbi:MAG TPA: VWA domain-containing protein [Pirellulaceae bacterium]|nr:VWA domain-containing protein [Pirellulaceae bacterium]
MNLAVEDELDTVAQFIGHQTKTVIDRMDLQAEHRLEPLLAGWDDSPRRHIPAWLMSCLLHTLVFCALAILFHWTPRGASDRADRSGGIVLVQAETDVTEYLSEGDFSDESVSNWESEQSPPPLPSASERPPDLPGMDLSAAQVSAAGADPTASLPSADALREPQQSNRQIGGKVTTQIFGVPGTGSRFVYVFDRSASMSDYNNKPLRAAKQQLLACLQSLADTSQFQVIFYNHEPQLFGGDGGSPRLFFANDENRRAAEQYIQGVRATGGTDHLKALKLALSTSPDVIFMLTDAEGGLSPAEMADLTNRNRSGAVINLIEFGVGQRRMVDRSLERFALESGGQYLYKNILTLDD